jgi:hypothetical protein
MEFIPEENSSNSLTAFNAFGSFTSRRPRRLSPLSSGKIEKILSSNLLVTRFTISPAPQVKRIINARISYYYAKECQCNGHTPCNGRPEIVPQS